MNPQFLERAMLITGGFEGSDPWANITGNFDGEGLTCGQLGKTIKAGDQQKVVRNYISAHGTAELLTLMLALNPRLGEGVDRDLLLDQRSKGALEPNRSPPAVDAIGENNDGLAAVDPAQLLTRRQVEGIVEARKDPGCQSIESPTESVAV